MFGIGMRGRGGVLKWFVGLGLGVWGSMVGI